MSKHFRRLKIKDIIRETAESISVVFEIPEQLKNEFSYRAGQYLTLKTVVDGEEIRRSYSLSSSPIQDAVWKITSKTVPNGKMSNYLDKHLKVGMEMDVMPPDGKYTTENLMPPFELVLFAAGSGITPIISILKSALAESHENKVNLFYGNSTMDSIIFKKELDELKQKYAERLDIKYILSRESSPDSPEYSGRMDEAKIRSFLDNLRNIHNKEYFICGPEGMIAACKKGLESLSIAPEKIHIEYFASPKTIQEEKKQQVLSGDIKEVKAIIDGEEHLLNLKDGETILEAAERLGVDPPFSCHSGVCTTCQAKVLRGTVEMENNFGLADEEVEQGFVLTCISTPTSPGVIISWDDV